MEKEKEREIILYYAALAILHFRKFYPFKYGVIVWLLIFIDLQLGTIKLVQGNKTNKLEGFGLFSFSLSLFSLR